MWKNELRISSVPTLSTNLKKIPQKPEDCNRKLQEYANKIKNTPLTMKEAYNSKEFEIYKPYFNPPNYEMTDKDEDFNSPKGENEERFFLLRKGTENSTFPQVIGQSKIYTYNPIPENVACEALEMLEKYDLTGGDYGETDPTSKVMDDYAIRIGGFNVINSTYLTLSIIHIPNQQFLVNLEIYKTEEIDTGTLPSATMGRFYNSSGFYLKTDWR